MIFFVDAPQKKSINVFNEKENIEHPIISFSYSDIKIALHDKSGRFGK